MKFNLHLITFENLFTNVFVLLWLCVYVKITIIILFVIGFLLTSAFSLNDAFAATTFVDAFDVSSQETAPTDLAFNTDGTKML